MRDDLVGILQKVQELGLQLRKIEVDLEVLAAGQSLAGRPLRDAHWVAETLGVDIQRVYLLARKRAIPVVRVGKEQLRFSEMAILRWMDQGGSDGIFNGNHLADKS
jgi:hypothetical protein